MVPYIEKWPQAMVLGIKHPNLFPTLNKISEISDEIWYQAGDRSLDASWYTKRGLLTKTYIATELFMIQDKSPDFEDTWDFLDRRLDEMFQVLDILDGSSQSFPVLS